MSAEKPQKQLPEMRVTVNVGVTGHRSAVIKEKGNPKALQGIIQTILSYIKEETTDQWRRSIAKSKEKLEKNKKSRHTHDKSSHAHDESAEVIKKFEGDPRFRVISSLAQGADRMVAQAGVDLAYELQCPLPMAVEEYKKTFESKEDPRKSQEEREREKKEEEEEMAHFDALLKKANSKFVIACHNSESSQSYADASRVMLRHSDFLIAVWDGKKTKSIAGTYATIRDARRAHIPIIHIPLDATDEDQVVVYTDSEGRRDWRNAVVDHLRDILEPPGNWHTIFAQQAPKPAKIWCFDKLLEDWLLRGFKFWLKKDTVQRSVPASGKHDYGEACKYSEQEWEKAKGYFSDSSRYYSAKYRSHVLLRYIFPVVAVFALVFATYGDVYKIPDLVGRCFGQDWSGFLPVAVVFYVLQILALVGVTHLVYSEKKQNKLVRHYSARFVAERCRQSRFLWAMGFCNVGVFSREDPDARESGKERLEQDLPSWCYRMLAREKGLPNLRVDQETIVNWLHWVKDKFAVEQGRYHHKRHLKCLNVDRIMHVLGLACYVGGLVFAVLQALAAMEYGGKLQEYIGTVIVLSLALVLPVLASFWASYASIAGYAVNGATSHSMERYFQMLVKNVDFLLANAGAASTEDHMIRFSGALSYTDILDLCENIDAACMEEVSDWESSTSTRCLTYI